MKTQTTRRQWRDRAQEFAYRTGEEIRESIDSPVIAWIAWMLAIGLLVALIRVAVTNITPYYELFRGTPQDAPWLLAVPLLGLILSAWNDIVSALGGTLIWGVIQIFQVLWILIALDRKAQLAALKQARETEIDPRQFRDRRHRRVARGVNRIPFFFIRWSAMLALTAYAFDFCLGISKYPPAKNLQVFFVAMMAGAVNRIDWVNFWKLVLMLFSFEALLVPFLIVVFWIRARRTAEA